MRPSPSALAGTLVLLLLPAALAAQTAGSTPGAARPPGCRGTSTQSSVVTFGRPDGPPLVFPDYPEIVSVQPGSPAERAGMRPRDVLVAQDGRDFIASPPPPRLAGDTVRLVVLRDGIEVPFTVVLGRWDPPQEAPGVTRICRPVGAGSGRN